MSVAALLGGRSRPSKEIRPNPGPQTEFLSSPADWVFYGGEAGGGKSFALEMEPLRHIGVSKFGAVIFRRTLTSITKEGGLWDEATQLYLPMGAQARQSPQREFVFPESGAKVQFGYLESMMDAESWKSAQICCLAFDQVEEIGERQFWYMTSRNRSRCQVPPYLRATCNPDPDSFLVNDGSSWGRGLISWWIDDRGYPIQERSGVIRWFQRIGGELVFGDSREEVSALARERDVKPLPKSLTFIRARLSDNPMMPHRDSYEASIASLHEVDRERLGEGNWLIRPAAGLIWNRGWFEIVEALPAVRASVRYWDKAAARASEVGDESAGGLVSRSLDGRFFIEDVTYGKFGINEREQVIRQLASADGRNVDVWVEQEGGSGGKESAQATVRGLAGHPVFSETVTGSKLSRWKPLIAQAQAGNVFLLEGPWNEPFLKQLHNATGEDGQRDDMIDAVAGAFNKVAAKPFRPIEGASMDY